MLLCPSISKVWILPKPVQMFLSTSLGFDRIQSLLCPYTGLVGPIALLSQLNVPQALFPTDRLCLKNKSAESCFLTLIVVVRKILENPKTAVNQSYL